MQAAKKTNNKKRGEEKKTMEKVTPRLLKKSAAAKRGTFHKERNSYAKVNFAHRHRPCRPLEQQTLLK